MQDDQLIKQCIKRNAKAQEVLYKRYLPYLLTIIRRYGIHTSNERDVIQEIFIEIFSSLPKYDSDKGHLKTWIRTLAVHKVLKIKRRAGSLLIVDIGVHQDAKNDKLISYQEHAPEYIYDAIKTLPTGYQTVFNLYEVDGYSHDEIAKMLNISAAGSRSQLSRARSMLRTKLISTKSNTK